MPYVLHAIFWMMIGALLLGVVLVFFSTLVEDLDEELRDENARLRGDL